MKVVLEAIPSEPLVPRDGAVEEAVELEGEEAM